MKSKMRSIVCTAGLIGIVFVGLIGTGCTSEDETPYSYSTNEEGEMVYSFEQEFTGTAPDVALSEDERKLFEDSAFSADRTNTKDDAFEYQGMEAYFSMTLPDTLDTDAPAAQYLSAKLVRSLEAGADFRNHLGKESTILVSKYGKVGYVQVTVSLADSDGALIGWWEDTYRAEGDPDLHWTILQE